MAKPPKRLALMAAGVAVGLVLFFVSSLFRFSEYREIRSGLPFPLSISAQGTEPSIEWLNTPLDVAFWIGVSLAALYAARFAVPYIRPKAQ